MKLRLILALALLLALLFLPIASSQPAQAQQPDVTGGVLVHTVIPRKVCVGDTLTLNGAASATYLGNSPIPWLPVTRVNIYADLGVVSPEQIQQFNDGFYFSFTYKATQPGTETIRLTVNGNVASTMERFEVEEKCDYDAFYTSVMHLTMDLGDEIFKSIAHVNGTGTMKRDREGSEFYQGEGKWHLEEKVLSKPSHCVEYYAPPLIMNGPFELDGHLADEGDTVDVILSFQPNFGESFYWGEIVCVDENGDVGTGWGSAQGGDPELASKVEATFPTGGGSQAVELEGKGMDIVLSVADVEYTATLTLIPR